VDTLFHDGGPGCQNDSHTHTQRGTTMSKSDTNRPGRRSDNYGRRQPRPPFRKTGTRKGAVRAAIREG
jgi:hypothetical protein